MFNLADFTSAFSDIKQIFMDRLKVYENEEFVNNLNTFIEYSAFGGKYLRAKIVVNTYSELVKRELTEKDKKIAYTLGWFVELIQACLISVDDIADKGEIRRNKPCYYIHSKRGCKSLAEIIFADCLNQSMIYSLESYLPKGIIMDILGLTRFTLLKTGVGQIIDTYNKVITMERYNIMVDYKTAYYSVRLPFLVGILASNTLPRELAYNEMLTNVCILMGRIYQIQDDWLDVFGDPDITGKIGKDIQEGKITWLICKSVEICTKEQRDFIVHNLGSSDHVNDIKNIFEDIKLKEYYDAECKKIKDEIWSCYEKLPDELKLNTIACLSRVINGRSR